MKHGQLFAGIGGFGLAAQWAGIENVWANEIDPYCCKLLRQNFPNTTIYENDIRDIGLTPNPKCKSSGLEKYSNSRQKRELSNSSKSEILRQGYKEVGSEGFGTGDNYDRKYDTNTLQYVDIITGGFPCQPFSTAGKRRGTGDDRYLWPEMLRVISSVKPRWVIGENVAGLVNMEDGRTLEQILSDLEAEGYRTESFLIPASATGAWHRRDRIWIVCQREQVNSNSNSIQGMEQEPQPGRNGRQDRLYGGEGSPQSGNYWQIEPNVGRVADGIPSWTHEPQGVPRVTAENKNRNHRLKALGNAIVPQVAYEIFKAIVKKEGG